MPTVTNNKKIKDMTAEEFQTLIRETIFEVIDPDYGLPLRPEVELDLRETIKQKERGEGTSLKEVKKQLNLR